MKKLFKVWMCIVTAFSLLCYSCSSQSDSNTNHISYANAIDDIIGMSQTDFLADYSIDSEAASIDDSHPRSSAWYLSETTQIAGYDFAVRIDFSKETDLVNNILYSYELVEEDAAEKGYTVMKDVYKDLHDNLGDPGDESAEQLPLDRFQNYDDFYQQTFVDSQSSVPHNCNWYVDRQGEETFVTMTVICGSDESFRITIKIYQ